MKYLSVILLCCLAAPIQAQTPTAELRLTSATASPGLPVVVRALLDHDMDCEAFS